MIDLGCLFPFASISCPWLAPAALLLDLRLGDPPLPWPHPVCLIGNFLNSLERRARIFAMAGRSARARQCRAKLAGGLCLLALCGIVWIACLALCQLPFIGALFAFYLAWAGLAAGSLLSTGSLVLKRIEEGDLTEAREAASWLVSRDTGCMDKALLRKTLADTMSENYTDAFVAPFFWLCLGGPCALWIYKAISTMDSQWGYITPRWRNLGFAGARADDFMAWLPARLSPFFLLLADKICLLSHCRPWLGRWPGWKIIARQAKTMTSPNSGWAMAACAWLCGGRMAGPSIYFGSLVQKGWLGPEADSARQWDMALLQNLFHLIGAAVLSGGLCLWLLFLFIFALSNGLFSA